ncbi:helix-turn-helix domain-containing protein [Actinoallomurus rhizosphaericola]|uniref:helix-turn-helix domain-containing protein n=1 Tax=Actinoallomurus rhizosphaericola TaxID=2952536 RepID=UPI0020915E98|nr:helix-turn-helix transcriptional regulator [Actinoallomurus rhizosphaericola]MCO5993979.1 helix-turn-helix domain-containing protein [Actinoallomurus rhizosphaericola]
MATITPTIRLRRLGMALRDHREAAGLTLDEAARVLMRSPSSLSRIEKGLHHVPVRDLEYILGKYGVADPAVRDRLFDWCRNGRKKGWWQRYATDLSPEMMDFIGLEADATFIGLFELILVPGLLQTEAYSRALMEGGQFADDPERIDRLVAVRMLRQKLLHASDPPTLWTVLDEAALRRRIGGTKTMRAQLQHLIDASELPQVGIQVIPFTTGTHRGVSGAFEILDIGDRGDLRIVTVDSLTVMSYREEQSDIQAYGTAFDRLRATALSERESQKLIAGLLSEL